VTASILQQTPHHHHQKQIVHQEYFPQHQKDIRQTIHHSLQRHKQWNTCIEMWGQSIAETNLPTALYQPFKGFTRSRHAMTCSCIQTSGCKNKTSGLYFRLGPILFFALFSICIMIQWAVFYCKTLGWSPGNENYSPRRNSLV
jgi:hypothetical protein